MKVYLDEQEWWPVYELVDNENDSFSETIIEVPEELYHEYQKIVTKFYEIQSKIIKIKDGNA